MKVYFHSILILASFILVFIWQNSEFAKYSVPFIGFLVFMFLLVSIRNKRNLNMGGPYNFFLLNTVLLLFIFSTGGISSNLFFILYFLLFGAAFIMDPRSVFMFPLGTLVIFWSSLFQGDVTANLLKVASLGFISPLAYFFGIQFKKGEEQNDEILKTKERASSSADDIAKDVEEIVESAKEKLDSNEVEKLNEILEETEGLRQETKTNS